MDSNKYQVLEDDGVLVHNRIRSNADIIHPNTFIPVLVAFHRDLQLGLHNAIVEFQSTRLNSSNRPRVLRTSRSEQHRPKHHYLCAFCKPGLKGRYLNNGV